MLEPCVELAELERFCPMHSRYFDLAAFEGLCKRDAMLGPDVLACAPSFSLLHNIDSYSKSAVLALFWIEGLVS